jgi:hypothetical protein
MKRRGSLSIPGPREIIKKALGTTVLTPRRRIWNACLAGGGIGAVILYSLCEETCVFLQGFMLGIDLKYLGLLYAGALVVLSLWRLDVPFLLALAFGIGAEAFLVGYQVKTGLYCYFCLSFAGLVAFLFLMNLGSALRLLGKEILGATAILGFVIVFGLFRGAAVQDEREAFLPTYGSGRIQVRLYTDFACQHCQVLEVKAGPLIRELVERKVITITFVNTVPDSLLGKYFLYILNTGNGLEQAMRARAVLFEAEQTGIVSRPRLERFLEAKNVGFKRYEIDATVYAMRRMIERDRINGTPTCVFYEEYNRQAFHGVAGIMAALEGLKE